MELLQNPVVLAVVAVLAVLLALRSGRGLLRLLLLFGVTVALALGVEWLVFVGIRTFYPQVIGTGLFQGLEAWAWLPAVLVGAFVTFISWREGV
jgi:hypothetical protein